ncbi:hypothetical protein ICE98_01277 [Lactococcus lactis]|nr:hypothetical protein [Lactococcus lactis]
MEFKSLLLLSLAAVSAVDPYLPTIFISATTLDDIEFDSLRLLLTRLSNIHFIIDILLTLATQNSW